MTPAADFYTLGESRYCLKSGAFSLEIDRLRRDRHELIGELSVRYFAEDEPAGRLISVADFNVSSQRARQDRARFIAGRTKGDGVDHVGLVEEFCQQVIAAEREGQPAVHLRDVPPPGPAAVVNVDGLLLPLTHPSCAFGDGGSLKSMLVLCVGGRLQQRGIRTLYLDWEFGEADHRDRLGRLFPDMPDVLYRRCERPLVVEADSIRRVIREERVEFVICDSVAFACDGPPESAEIASAYFRAVRSLGVGSLHVAHISKAEGGDKKPFGSTFWHNGFRSTWFIERAADSVDPATVRLGVFHRKCNVGPLQPALGFEFSFGQERTAVRRVDVAAAAEFSCATPLWQQIASTLKHGPLTLVAIARELSAKVDSVEKAVNRRRGTTFTRVSGADNITRIALLDRRTGTGDTCPGT